MNENEIAKIIVDSAFQKLIILASLRLCVRHPEKFNKLLNTIYTKGIEIARLEAQSGQEKAS